MQSRIEKTDDGVELVIEGRFTFTDHEAFQHVVVDLVRLRPTHCVIDLSAADYLDSAAVGMLVLLREQLDRSKLVLKGGNSSIKELIRIARLATLFEIAD